MTFWNPFLHYAFQYYGVDWLVTLTVFAGIFFLGEKKREGFLLGMFSSALGLILSFQIRSIANGLASITLFFLYFRGYLQWHKQVGPGQWSQPPERESSC